MGASLNDFRVSCGFLRNPKIVLLKRRTGAEGVLALLSLWDFAASERDDGNLSVMTDEKIEAAAGWTGEPGEWLTAASELGLLDGKDGERKIHEWALHQPYITTRAARVVAGRIGGLASAASKRQATVEQPSTVAQPPSLPIPSSEKKEKKPESLRSSVLRNLRDLTGSGKDPCSAQVRALEAAGMPLEEVATHVERARGMANVWKWKDAVLALHQRNGHGTLDPTIA